VLLFLDESGTDRRDTPYEVTGGIAIGEDRLWEFVQDVDEAQRACFGDVLREVAPRHEFKATTLLARDKFRFAAQGGTLPAPERASLARAFLEAAGRGLRPRRAQFTAYGQACAAYVGAVLDVCATHEVRVFASMVDRQAPRADSETALRRDVAFLLERFAYYIEDIRDQAGGSRRQPVGILVADELEHAQCRRLLGRLQRYFQLTARGREWGRLIVPEPFFVHSHLTTGTQVADLVVYVPNWACRYGGMEGAVREELRGYAGRLQGLVHVTKRADETGTPRLRYSVVRVPDLRPRDERVGRPVQ